MRSVSRTFLILASAAVVATGLSACSSTIHDEARIGDFDTLSIDAKQRLVLFGRDRDGQPVVCAEPSPDALVARAAVLAASGSGAPPAATGTTATPINVGFSGGSTEAAASIGLRTQSIQLLRDGYYRLCEGLLNGVVEKDDYTRVVANIDTFMTAVMAIDTIGGTTAAPAVAIAPGKVTASVTKDGTSTVTTEAPPGGDSGTLRLLEINAQRDLSKIQAESIANIFANYLDYRQKFNPLVVR